MSFPFQPRRVLRIQKTLLVDWNDTVKRVVRRIQHVSDFVTVYVAASLTLCVLTASHTIG